MQVSKMIKIMQGLPENVIGAIYSGTVTGKDYEDVLIPVFKEKLKKYGKLRLLYQINTGISHFAWSSYLEDSKVSWHIFSFEKVAIVSDIHWVDESVKLFAFMMPMPTKAFTGDRLDEAKAWVSE
jgi:hypothetical protein